MVFQLTFYSMFQSALWIYVKFQSFLIVSKFPDDLYSVWSFLEYLYNFQSFLKISITFQKIIIKSWDLKITHPDLKDLSFISRLKFLRGIVSCFKV